MILADRNMGIDNIEKGYFCAGPLRINIDF